MIEVPVGFRVAGRHCGLKTNPKREDITLVVSDAACVAAGCYTTNHVVAAPVVVDRQRTPSDDVRVVVVNSGNANACTGPDGMRDALEMARLAAEVCGARPEQALVMSTGIIGEMLPMAKVTAGIVATAEQLARDEAAFQAAARGIMTTDTRAKLAGRRLEIGGHSIQITGLAKGSGMIGPRMATMLGVIMTDARLTPQTAQSVLSQVVDESFNCVSVDGHTSTNDTVLLLASGRSGGELTGETLEGFRLSLHEVCAELAREVADDGEGATHLIEIDVTGCTDNRDARQIAEAIANSPLVKTAIAGADPNWGRIVSAAGYAGPTFDVQSATLHVNGILLFENGVPQRFDAEAASASIRGSRDTKIELQLGTGAGTARFWTCDLTQEYIRINADYHT